MISRSLAVVGLVLLVSAGGAWAADRMQFWNLTGVTITRLSLAPAGTTTWGPNQCANDKDGSVDPDERLRLTGVTAGQYDVRLTDTAGRQCTVKNVTVQSGKAVTDLR